VNRFTGDGPVDAVAAEEIIGRLLGQFAEARIGRFIVIEKATGDKIGWAGLRPVEKPGAVDLGYRFQRDRWGRGYATEASIECLRYGFTDLNYEEMIAEADPRNVASVRVLEKLGFVETERGRDEDGDYVNFALARDEWRRRLAAVTR
jgi:RimJ/RimL family protein N-acetyltransferase